MNICTICYTGIEFHCIYTTYVLGPPSAEVYGSDFRSVPLVAELGERLCSLADPGACGW